MTSYTNLEKYNRLLALDNALNLDTMVYYLLNSIMRRNPEFKDEVTLDAERNLTRLIRTGHTVRIASEYKDYRYYLNVDYKPVMGVLRRKSIQVDTVADFITVFDYIASLSVGSINSLANTVKVALEIKDPYLLSKAELSAEYWHTWVDRLVPDTAPQDRDGVFRDAVDLFVHLMLRPNPKTFLEIRNYVITHVDDQVTVEELVGVVNPKDPTEVVPPTTEVENPTTPPTVEPTPEVPPTTSDNTSEVYKEIINFDKSVEHLVPDSKWLSITNKQRLLAFYGLVRAVLIHLAFKEHRYKKVSDNFYIYFFDEMQVQVEFKINYRTTIRVIIGETMVSHTFPALTKEDFEVTELKSLALLYKVKDSPLPEEFKTMMQFTIEEEEETYELIKQIEAEKAKELENTTKTSNTTVNANLAKVFGNQLLAVVLSHRDLNEDSIWSVFLGTSVIIRNKVDEPTVVVSIDGDYLVVAELGVVRKETSYRYTELTLSESLKATSDPYLLELAELVDNTPDIQSALRRVVSITGVDIDQSVFN